MNPTVICTICCHPLKDGQVIVDQKGKPSDHERGTYHYACHEPFAEQLDLVSQAEHLESKAA